MDPQDWDIDQLQNIARKYGIPDTTELTKDELWTQIINIVDPQDLRLEFYRWKRENIDSTPIKFSDIPILSPKLDIKEPHIKFSDIPILFPDEPEEPHVEEQKQALLAKEKLLEERENLLKSKKQRIEEQEAALASKQKRIKIREKKIASKIKQKEQTLTTQKKQLILKQKQSKKKQEELSTKENAIVKLQEEAEQKNLELLEQKKQLQLEEKKLATLQREKIVTKEELISRKRALELQEELLARREQHLNEEEARISEKRRDVVEDIKLDELEELPYDEIYPFIAVHNNCLVDEEAEIEEINFCTDNYCKRYTSSNIPIEVKKQRGDQSCVKTLVFTTVEDVVKNVENITLLELVYYSHTSGETYEIEIEDFIVSIVDL